MATLITSYEFWFERLTDSEREIIRGATQTTVDDPRFDPKDLVEFRETLFLLHNGIDLEQMQAKAEKSPLRRAYRLLVILFGKKRANELTTTTP